MRKTLLILLATVACAQNGPVRLPTPPPPVSAAIAKDASQRNIPFASLTAVTGVPGATHQFVLAKIPAPDSSITVYRKQNGVVVNQGNVAVAPPTQLDTLRRTVRLDMPDLVGAPPSTLDVFDFIYESLEP